jgi:hypothetical protein
MNAFYDHHKDSIRWHYRCFDRILLNASFNHSNSRKGCSASSTLSLTSPRHDGFPPLLQCQSISKPLIMLIRGAKNPSNSPM